MMYGVQYVVQHVDLHEAEIAPRGLRHCRRWPGRGGDMHGRPWLTIPNGSRYIVHGVAVACSVKVRTSVW
jgi:hypothetical protein